MFQTMVIGGYPLMVYEKDGKRYVWLAGCPHKRRPITADGFRLDGDNIVCPFHKAVFSLITGELVSPPISKTPCNNCRLIRAYIDDGVRFDGEAFVPREKG
ncbi:Rieske (2Fe-2S) protein [Acidianus manzaensis]|uniref:Rieske domain-containing protein n=1 Tax=Acidianus manzaensis TaxID=282676 RepID=A0A1W6K260_9CREN|nr:Rieske 2Fe-2S domain-containing protein [Acidianus manzaensis]ARM76606.1 hypothetical protein B6F84_11640 [Acidianus manzaensis]